MAGRIHVNPETGEPGKCSAKIACRFGEDAPHFEFENDARLYFEMKMEDGEEEARRVISVIDTAREFERADSKLRIAQQYNRPYPEDEEKALSEAREGARAKLAEQGLEPEDLIDHRRYSLRKLADIRAVVLRGKSAPSDAYLEKKVGTWDSKLDKVLAETADKNDAARDRAFFNLKLMILRELPTKSVLRNDRLNKSLSEDGTDYSKLQRIGQSIPGVSEAAQNRRAAKVAPGNEEEYISKALNRAADIFEKIDGIRARA